MKTQVCLPKILLLTAVLGMAGPWTAVAATPATGRSGTKAVTTSPPKAPEPEPKIPGFVVPRTGGGFLSLLVEDGKFKLTFYGVDKKPVAADVARASARWVVRYKIADERTILNPTDDGMALTSSKFVRPPYQFKLYLTLLGAGEGEGESEGQAVEQYVIDFRQ